MMVRPHPVPTKVLAIPTSGKQPAFDEVVDIALTGAFCGLSVCVMCLTEEMLDRWRSRLEDLSHPIILLDVLNTNRATLEDWQAFLNAQTHDVTALHGAQSELNANWISVSYVTALVDAIPSGLVVVA